MSKKRRRKKFSASDPHTENLHRSDKIEVSGQDYLEHRVRFSLKFSSTSRGKSITDISNRKDLTNWFKRLGFLEEKTFKEIKQMDRRRGFSTEKKSSSNHQNMYKAYGHHNLDTFCHFRIPGTSSNFRVFGALKDGLVYLLEFDPKGLKNH